MSCAKAWWLAEREAKGYWRLSPRRRAAVIEARRENPDGTQQGIRSRARESGAVRDLQRRAQPQRQQIYRRRIEDGIAVERIMLWIMLRPYLCRLVVHDPSRPARRPVHVSYRPRLIKGPCYD